jgi:plasmid maintenance system antidote protein VapI
MNERLKILLDELKNRRVVHNYADFALQMGKPRSIISELLNGKRTISELFVHEMTTKFPQVNADWLLTGNGEMLKEETQLQNAVTEQPQEQGMIDKLFFLVESQRKDIETLIQLVKNKDEKIEELLEELDARKKGDATNVVSSSSASAV